MTEDILARIRRNAQFLTRDGARFRTVITDSESYTGVAPVCDSAAHPADDRDPQRDVLDCCAPVDVLEVYSEQMAQLIVDTLAWMSAEVSARLPCSKCGYSSTDVEYCTGGQLRQREGVVCRRAEHFHRRCLRCGYSWQTFDVLGAADVPA